MDFLSGLMKVMGHDTIRVVVDHFTNYSNFLLLSLIHIKPRLLLHYLFMILYVCMVFPNQLCLIEMLFLSANFGKNCSSCLLLASNRVQLITLKQMVKLRLVIAPWSLIYIVLQGYIQNNGQDRFSIPLTMGPPILPLLKEVNEQLIAKTLFLMNSKLFLPMLNVKWKFMWMLSVVKLSSNDLVYLRVQPSKLPSLAKKVNKKLIPRYYGPYYLE